MPNETKVPSSFAELVGNDHKARAERMLGELQEKVHTALIDQRKAARALREADEKMAALEAEFNELTERLTRDSATSTRRATPAA